MIKVSFSKLKKAVEEAIAERGEDWVYPDASVEAWRTRSGLCRYFLGDGSPACIVGTAISKIDESIDVVSNGAAADDAFHGYIEFSEKAAQFAAHLQKWQDNGHTWGEAYSQAIKSTQTFDD